jgi:hypothetical protein
MHQMTTEEQRIVSDIMELVPEELTPDELEDVASVLRLLPSSMCLHGAGDAPMAQRTYWFEADQPGFRSYVNKACLAIADRRANANESTMFVRVFVQPVVFFHIPLELGERLCELGGDGCVRSQR